MVEHRAAGPALVGQVSRREGRARLRGNPASPGSWDCPVTFNKRVTCCWCGRACERDSRLQADPHPSRVLPQPPVPAAQRVQANEVPSCSPCSRPLTQGWTRNRARVQSRLVAVSSSIHRIGAQVPSWLFVKFRPLPAVDVRGDGQQQNCSTVLLSVRRLAASQRTGTGCPQEVHSAPRVCMLVT